MVPFLLKLTEMTEGEGVVSTTEERMDPKDSSGSFWVGHETELDQGGEESGLLTDGPGPIVFICATLDSLEPVASFTGP